jgi:hypothetical protein
MGKRMGLGPVIHSRHIQSRTTHVAKSCVLADVQSAVALANDGDIVRVPPGSVVWTGTLTMGNIALIGSGMGSTVIEDRTGTGFNEDPIIVQGSLGKRWRIAGFSFTGHGTATIIRVDGDSDNWSIDNNEFRSIEGGHAIHFRNYGGMTYGAIHSNVFDQTFQETGFQGVQLVSDPISWETQLEYGTQRSIYIESNLFDFGAWGHNNVFDADDNARAVYRYNDVIGAGMGTHGLDSGSNHSFFSLEMYHNRFTRLNTPALANLIRIRGGTGLLFNNAIVGTNFSRLVNADEQRTFQNFPTWGICSGGNELDGNEPIYEGTHTGANGASALADSSQAWVVDELVMIHPSFYTGNHTGSSGATTLVDSTKSYPTNYRATKILYNLTKGAWGTVASNTATTVTASMQDGSPDSLWDHEDAYDMSAGMWVWNLTTGAKGQIRANTATGVTAALEGGGRDNLWNEGDEYKITDGYPGHQQVGRSYQQSLEPLYVWGNLRDGLLWEASENPNINNWQRHVRLDRDFYNADFGPIASRPSTCTPIEAYWATDERALYQCTATDTWEPYYRPFVYPHPIAAAVTPVDRLVKGGVLSWR